jgi:hypothetical protein
MLGWISLPPIRAATATGDEAGSHAVDHEAVAAANLAWRSDVQSRYYTFCAMQLLGCENLTVEQIRVLLALAGLLDTAELGRGPDVVVVGEGQHLSGALCDCGVVDGGEADARGVDVIEGRDPNGTVTRRGAYGPYRGRHTANSTSSRSSASPSAASGNLVTTTTVANDTHATSRRPISFLKTTSMREGAYDRSRVESTNLDAARSTVEARGLRQWRRPDEKR